MLKEIVARDVVAGTEILDIVTGQAHRILQIEVNEEPCKSLNCASDQASGCGGRMLSLWYDEDKKNGVIVCESRPLSERVQK